MKIKKLQIYGFKTFVQPTEIIFHDGVTSVVGPNGCGKSNIIDAIRWVMGEKSAKGLRGDSMEDVIFSGCASRKALNFAEVTLTLTEVEGKLPEKFGNYHEIAVTRRLHRSGESEYLINKVSCRLKDVVDLFLDTGLGKKAYSIIEQGRIDAILSMKPADRRFLIEEAAGLSKYRARRDESLAKMKQTQENLDRLNDIIVEVRREMTTLKRQAGRARAFKELRTERRSLDRDLLAAVMAGLDIKKSEAETGLQSVKDELAGARTHSDKLVLALEKLRLELAEEEKALEESQRRVYGLKNQISERESRIHFLEREADGFITRSARADEEALELTARAAGTAEELAEHKAALEELAEDQHAREAGLEKAERALKEALEARRAEEARLETHRKAVFDIMTSLSRVQNSLEHNIKLEKDAHRRLEQYDRLEDEICHKLSEVDSETRTRKTDLMSAERALEEMGEEKGVLEEDFEDLAFTRQNLAKRVEETAAKLASAETRLKSLKELKEGLDCYAQGVKAFLKHARDGKWTGVRGVVADILSVPGKYEAALEAALGERLQYVVVADALQAAEGIAFLKEGKAGRSSFAPVDLRESPASRAPQIKAEWAHGPLLDLVTVEPGGDRLARALLGGFFVVENLDRAFELWNANPGGQTYVTLDGDTLSPEGVVTGGRNSSSDAGLLKRNREIGELTSEAAELSAKLDDIREELSQTSERYAETERRLSFLKEEAHRQELKVAHVSRDMAQYEERRERLEERRQALEFERDDVHSELKRLSESANKLESERAALILRSESAELDRLAFEETLTQAARKADGIQSEINRLRIELAGERQRREGLVNQIRALEKSREATLERAERMKREARELVKEHGTLTGEKEKLRLELEVLAAELLRSSAKADELMRSMDGRRAEVTKNDKDAGQARRAAEEVQERLSKAELALREIEMETRLLVERYAERHGGDIAEALNQGVPEGFDPEAARAKIQELDEKIRQFGEVNLLADDEYEERKTRYDFLETQRTDLDQSMTSLKNAIAHINRVSRERFGETFEAVNEKFKELYPVLFRGGEAELFLTDSENLLETGIDIIARPPGKRPQHMSLLSGGEKALTAVALIFSLFLVKPSPFCVLDEVDAPLDDANVERFTDLLKEMSLRSQFLVITHNKITMEAAAHLYGVTQEEAGISNLVSVRLKDHLATAEVA